MENEEIKKPEGVSLVDEARAIRDEIIKEREALQEERKLLQKTQAEGLLSSTAGGHIEAKPVVEDTSKEYSDKVMTGEIKAE